MSSQPGGRVVVPIVEGDGEVRAIGVLLRRLLQHHGVYHLEVAKPIRRPRSQLVKMGELETWARVAAQTAGCLAVLVLLDADTDCPASLGPQVHRRAAAAAQPVPLSVVLAKHEFEAWFLAGIEGLRGKRRISLDAQAPRNPERVRGAKEELSRWMPPNQPYSETRDQPACCELFDLGWAHRRSRSFRKLWKEVETLVRQLGTEPVPPPAPG